MQDAKKLSKRTFDRQAAYYDERATTGVSKFPKKSYPFVLEKVRELSPKRLLDLGCGTGEMLRLLRQMDQDVELAGIDLSSNMIAKAKEKGIPNAVFLEGDAEHLPYPSSYFDMVCCVQSFHHYPNPLKALAEGKRVLRPGGVFVLCDMYVANPVFRWAENKFLLRALRLGDVHTYGRREICALMEEAGFSSVKWKRVDPVIFLCVGRR